MLGVAPPKPLHADAQHTPRTRPDAERRHEDTRRELDPKCHDGQYALDEHRDENRARDGPDLRERPGVRGAEHRAPVRFTLSKEVGDKLGAAHAREWIDKAEDGGDHGDLGMHEAKRWKRDVKPYDEDFSYGMPL